MKKSLVALAALAFVGAASAQSSVMLYGVLDADIAHFSQGGLGKTMLTSSGNSGSLLGFRGTEDLGGGLSANFWLESTLLNDTGSGLGGGLTFNRRSTVSLASDFGEIRLGRDYTPSFINHYVFDPFLLSGPGAGSNITLGGGANGVAGGNAATAVRANNSIQYLWGFNPNAIAAIGSGVYAQLMYAFPENVSGMPALGQYTGGRLGYANGPVNAAISYAQSKGTPYAADVGQGYSTYKELNLAGSYRFGVGQLMAHAGTNNSDAAGTKYTHWGLGATINAGPGYIPIAFNSIKQNNVTSDGANQIAVGYVYALSKRTVLYGSVARIHNKNNGTYTFSGSNGGNNPGLQTAFGGGTSFGNGTGYGIGLRTSF
ncbi:porin [Polaromonas sp. C04]|uniref:porin n=1 Tax=Polaromonas sp. C04 TaxID=1945857 RepID=UPI00098489FD|nr:porin [Polaromonas sp. C04]OOG58737.1 porin [Polaromonas sp. C04]